jgi:uncharacterized protein (TIGR02145 family)
MNNNQLIKLNYKSDANVVFFNHSLSFWSLFYAIAIATIFGCASENNSVKTAPQLTTTTITNITLNSAVSGGNVTSDGGDAVNARGIVWSTVTSPTTSLTTRTTDGSGIGNFSSLITNLLPSSTYFVRAYATNSIGTGYGNELSFTTGAIVLPTLTTTAITNITTNSSVSGGNISNDGGGIITTRGIVWSTSQNPTISLTTKTTDGTGLGSFVSNMTTLVQNTTYYVRAYATNSVGTAYGNQVDFKTNASLITGTVTDVDGNVYKTIQIGTQVWMAENLNVTKYSDGTPIQQVTSPLALGKLTTGAWCYYNNNPANGPIYGKLYNWYAAVGIYDASGLYNSSYRKQIAPAGWHLPTQSDWLTLINFLGGSTVAGGKMKEAGITHWTSPNTADNSSGFTALPGGACDNYSFGQMSEWGSWWSSTDASSDKAIYLPIYYGTTSAIINNFPKAWGSSICYVKD